MVTLSSRDSLFSAPFIEVGGFCCVLHLSCSSPLFSPLSLSLFFLSNFPSFLLLLRLFSFLPTFCLAVTLIFCLLVLFSVIVLVC